MKAEDIKAIVLSEIDYYFAWFAGTDSGTAAANAITRRLLAKIEQEQERKWAKLTQLSYYPQPSCDCGAARVGAQAKHGPMCSLLGGGHGGRGRAA